MNPPSILLDRSFLVAVADHDEANHDDAVATFRSLIDEFLAQRCLLVARADHLSTVAARVANSDLFAVLDKLHVARQHRNAAADLVARTGVGIDEAITMVLIHRCRIRRVLSFDPRLAGYEVDAKVALPAGVANFVAASTVDVSAATNLAPEAS